MPYFGLSKMINTMNFFECRGKALTLEQSESVVTAVRRAGKPWGLRERGRHGGGSLRRAPAPLAQHRRPKEAEAPPSKPCRSVTVAALLSCGLWVFSPLLPSSLLQCVHASWSSMHVCVLVCLLEVQTAPICPWELESVPGIKSVSTRGNQP